MHNKTIMQTLDYAILAVTMIASLLIGFYFACFGGKQKTTAEYFTGGRNMQTIPIVMSMLAGYITSSMLLGLPTEVYHFGADYWYTTIGAFIGGTISIYGFVPVFYKLQITSVYEYIQYRFGSSMRLYNSIMNIFSLLMLTGFVIYAPALALSQATGLGLWTSIISTTAIGTIYTSIGGIKAVVWTDVFQLLIFTASMLATIIKGSISAGGLNYIIDKSIEGKRLSTLSFSLDPTVRYTAWGLIISSTLRSIILYGVSQIQLQRYMCCPNNKAARRNVWLNVIFSVPLTLMYCFVGLVLYAMYWNCDPLSSQQIEKPDQLFPLFVMQTMSSIPGMPGLFVAGIYSAALSTLSSILNSVAAITLQDLIRPRWKELSDYKATCISKCLAATYGIICLLIIVGIINLGAILQGMQYLLGASMGANLGLFFLGLLIPWANSKGTGLGIVCGLGLAWWIVIGAQVYRPRPTSFLRVSTINCSDILGDWTPRAKSNDTATQEHIPDIYKISYLWILPIAFSVTVFVGSLSSLFIGSNKNLNMELLSPFVHTVMKKCFYKKYKQLEANHNSIPQEEKICKHFSSTIDIENVNKLTTPEANKLLLIKANGNFENRDHKINKIDSYPSVGS